MRTIHQGYYVQTIWRQEEALNTLLIKTQYSPTTCMKELDKLMVAEIGTYSIRLETVEALVALKPWSKASLILEISWTKTANVPAKFIMTCYCKKTQSKWYDSIEANSAVGWVSYLKKAGYPKNEIQRRCPVHPYRVKLTEPMPWNTLIGSNETSTRWKPASASKKCSGMVHPQFAAKNVIISLK